MTSETLASEGGENLGHLQDNVRQNEGIIGPLIALSSVGDNNLMTFEIGDIPGSLAELEVISSGDAPAKPGHVVVCTGHCLVSGESKRVVAYRAE